VKVDLDVFGALMLHRIGGEIDSTHIVTVNECGTRRRVVELLKELTEPRSLGNSICNCTIFSLSAGARNRMLAFARPGNQVVTKEDSIP